MVRGVERMGNKKQVESFDVNLLNIKRSVGCFSGFVYPVCQIPARRSSRASRRVFTMRDSKAAEMMRVVSSIMIMSFCKKSFP